jgi:hypothetical protein
MNRLFGSDILHTWVLGFVEAAVGFTLQIVKYIGHPNVDRTYSQSPKKLIEIIKRFPSHNSLQPMKKHVIFTDILELYQSPTSKKGTNPLHTTGMLKRRLASDLPCALMQIFFALSDEDLLPSDFNWSKNMGFSKPFFSPRQILINALNAVLEVHWYLKATSLSESQLTTLQMLISNAQAQMLVLDVIRKRIISKATTPKKEYVDIPVSTIGLMNNVKFEMLTHLVDAKKQCGCDNNARDTELGEMLMKSCKVLFNDTNRRYHTVLKDMLRKYLHLQYLSIAAKGLVDNKSAVVLSNDSSKAHNTSDCERDFKTNRSYKKQEITWVQGSGAYRTRKDGANWCVHPMLKLVTFFF